MVINTSLGTKFLLSVFYLLCFVKVVIAVGGQLSMPTWPVMYQIDCKICTLVTPMRSQLATVPVLKVMAKPGIQDLPDLLNQPISYSQPIKSFGKKTEVKHSLQTVVQFQLKQSKALIIDFHLYSDEIIPVTTRNILILNTPFQR